ncbi:MAG: HD domain-containing protein [Bacteroidota bacterium]
MNSSENNFSNFLTHPIFKIVSEIADSTNVKAFVIGGYVRDLLLGRNSKDIDIVTVGSGIDLAQKVAEHANISKVSFFKNFGTAMLRLDDMEIEFVGARRESYRSDSRKPIVEDGTIEDDQKRRDFTINALAISLNKTDFGNLIDPFDGISDLGCKIIRTPLEPDITYSDDPLRMMRAIRFATQLQFTITDESIESITKNAERIKIVSAERIADELNKIILSPKPSIGFKLLSKTKILEIIFPQFEKLKGVTKQKGLEHKDNFYHTLEVLDNISHDSNDLWLRWAAILHDIAKPATKRFVDGIGWTFYGHEVKGGKMVPEVFQQLKLPMNEKMKYVQKIVSLHLRPIALTEEHVTDSAVRRLLFDAGDDVDDLMTLCKADITSKNEQKVKSFKENFDLVKAKLIELEQRDQIRNWQPPITGEIIMETFNIGQCKEIGVIKSAIKEAILDGIIPNEYEKAYQFMLDKGKEIGLCVSLKS